MRRHSWLGLVFSFALAATAAAFAGSGHGPSPVVGYVEVSDSQSAATLADARAAHLSGAAVGFIVADGRRCVPAWDGAGPVARHPFAARMAALSKSGVRPVLSFGGQGGRELALACRTPQALAGAYGAALGAYGVHSMDLDLEGPGLSASADSRRAQALALLQRQDPALSLSITLPVDTTGLPPEAERALRAIGAAGVRVAHVNVMAMDFGSEAPHPHGRMAAYAEGAARGTLRQLRTIAPSLASWSHLALTVMIGQNDTRAEVVTLADAHELARFARATGLGELRYWSLNRDRACGRPTRSASDTCSGLPQARNAFARALNGLQAT